MRYTVEDGNTVVKPCKSNALLLKLFVAVPGFLLLYWGCYSLVRHKSFTFVFKLEILAEL